MSKMKDIISEKHITDYDVFLTENAKYTNERLNAVIRMCIITGPLLALCIKFNLIHGVSIAAALQATAFLVSLAVVHQILMRRFPSAYIVGFLSLYALGVLTIILDISHLTIRLLWFLVPLLSILYCNLRFYLITVLVNYSFMIFAVWYTADYYASLRVDYDTAFDYFNARMGGLTIELVALTAAGYVLCNIITRYYRGLIAQNIQTETTRKTLSRSNNELSSIADIYMCVYDIDVKNNLLTPIRINHRGIEEYLTEYHNDAKAGLISLVHAATSHLSREEMLKFSDLDTLEARVEEDKPTLLEFMDTQGRWRRSRFVVSERDDEGLISHVTWMLEDVDNEKKDREKLIDISERAIAASEAKSAFLSNMSHEIRTPINAVLGMDEMILRMAEDPDILRYAENIRLAGNTLLGIINDVLDFSRIESGKMEINPGEYDLASLLNDLINMIQPRVDEKKLKLNTVFDRKIPRILYGDELRIKQVITNILANAVKYTNRGEITFTLGYEKIDDEPDHVRINVSVEDTGIGIRKEDMPRLFSEFDRLEEDRNKSIEGTGLGLSITKRLLELMGSTLQVESVYGRGSKFYFSLKQRVSDWEELGDYESAYQTWLLNRKRYTVRFTAPNARVLMVDDNDMNLAVFEGLLKPTKISVDLATSGDEGLALTESKKYDLIFLDHMMPKKDGIMTLRELKSQTGGQNRNTPVICLTANAIAGAKEEYLQAGFDDYLSKPIDSVKLEDLLLSYLPEGLVESKGEGSEQEEDLTYTEEDFALEMFLKENSCIDFEKGMTASGSLSAYRSLLSIFKNSTEEKLLELDELYRSKDYENYTIKAHALKSSAHIIGAEEYAESAREMEFAGKRKDEEYILKHHEALLREGRLIVSILKMALGDEEPEKDLPLMESEEIDTAIKSIRIGAKNLDYNALDKVFARLQKYRLPEEYKKKIQAAKKCFDRLDYDGIIEIL